MMLKEGLGVDIISVENREVKAVKPEKWISVESQPKQMPITTMENITLTDTREIESSLIGGEMAKKIKKMLTQPQQIEKPPRSMSVRDSPLLMRSDDLVRVRAYCNDIVPRWFTLKVS